MYLLIIILVVLLAYLFVFSLCKCATKPLPLKISSEHDSEAVINNFAKFAPDCWPQTDKIKWAKLVKFYSDCKKTKQ